MHLTYPGNLQNPGSYTWGCRAGTSACFSMEALRSKCWPAEHREPWVSRSQLSRGCGSCAPGVGGIALIFEGTGVRWPSGWGRAWDPLPRSLRLQSRGLGVDLWEVENLRSPRGAQLAVPLLAHSGGPEAVQGLTAATHGWGRGSRSSRRQFLGLTISTDAEFDP